MSNKMGKTRDLYLRGFKSEYIKRRTNISVQSFLKQEKAQGRVYSNDDKLKYQESYIREKYTNDDVIKAYIEMSNAFASLENAAHKREIIVLGCCFGQYAKVFRNILGEVEYGILKNRIWQKKQSSVVRDKYGVDNVFSKETFSNIVSDEAVLKGRIKRNETMLERYGVSEPNQHPEIKRKAIAGMRATNLERYGVEHAMQNTDIAQKSKQGRQKTMLEKYGAANSVSVPEIREKIFQSRKKNGTLNTSKPEEHLYEMLVSVFGVDDVKRQIQVDERYPYMVDFYIVSRDMFIELNGDACHGTHWFDETCVSDRQKRDAWIENANKSKIKHSRYKKYVETWTVSDVKKRECAKKNALNYVVFWDGGSIQRNKKKVASLIDARAWFDAGCPNRQDWK